MDKKRILVVDDESHVRLLVRKMLDRDYIVLEAANGEEAVHAARTQQPDLILVVTAVGNEFNKKFALEVGAAGYVIKPFSTNGLIAVISRLLVGTG